MLTQRNFSITVAFTLLIGQHLSSCSQLNSHKEIYDQVSEYLQLKLAGNNDVVANLDLAIDWLQSEKLSDKVLKQFENLKSLLNDSSCDDTSYQILVDSRRDSRFKAPNPFELRRHIDGVLHDYYLKHAKQCQNHYFDRFKTRYSQLDGDKLKFVETFSLGRIYSAARYITEQTESERWTPCKRADLMQNFSNYPRGLRVLTESANDYGNPKLVLTALKYLAKNDSAAASCLANFTTLTQTIDINECEEKIETSFNKYLIEPCEYYLTKLSSDLFRPARIDFLAFINVQPMKREQLFESNVDYFIGQSSYEICDRLYYGQSFLSKRLLSLLSE